MPDVNEPPDGSNALQELRLDRNDPTALHEQAAAAIRRAIADGEAGPGQRIPQARDLAAVLGIDRNTVLRALRLLRDEGLLEMGRGRANTVTGNADTGSVTTKAKELIEYARHRGYKREELIALITRLP
jgi:GntR family transcriptional regulator